MLMKPPEALLSPDPAGFFESVIDPLHAYVASRTGAPAAQVDDLVQETLLHAWKNRERFRGEASVETWVLSIARNKIRDVWRGRLRKDRHLEVVRAIRNLEVDDLPSDLAGLDEMRSVVRGALGRLDPDYASILILRYFHSTSIPSIASTRGESEKAVESRLHRAREAFRRELRKEENPDDE